MFSPIAFKGHVFNCRRLEEDMNDGPAFDSQAVTVKVAGTDGRGEIKFSITCGDLQWVTAVKLDEVQFVARQLREKY